MKTKKMTKTIIGVLAGVLLLSLSATAQATLSPNLLVNGDFTSGSISDNETSGLLSNGVWYGSGKKWDRKSSGGNPDAYASLGNNKTEKLFQAVQVSQQWPSHVATAGPVLVSFDYKSNNIIIANTYAKLYGSSAQPSYGSYGIELASIADFSSSTSTWMPKSLSSNATSGYDWYTLVIYGATGKGGGGGGASFKVDNVSVQVTPIPAAVWLLGSGLIGLAVLRRRTKT